MKKLPFFGLCVIALIATAAIARPLQTPASAVGTWDITIVSPQGERKGQIVFKQEGDKLTGLMKSPRGDRALDSVTVKGSDITFAMTVPVQGQDMVITYKGKIEKDSMKGDADFGGFATGTWSAVPHKEDAAAATAPPAPAPTASSSAMNITGMWDFKVETPNGTGNPTFTLKQDGENLTGTYKGQFGESPVTGTVKGSDVKISLKINAQGQDVNITYTGKIDGKDSMGGKVSLGDFGEGTWTAKKKS